MAELRWRLPAGLVVAAVTGLVLPPAGAAETGQAARFNPFGLLLSNVFRCPFCVDERGPTMVADFQQASMVLYGHFTNPKLGKGDDIDTGSSDFVIEVVLKSHDYIKGKKEITLPKYIPVSKSKFVVFCDVYKTDVKPYRGEEAPPDSDLLNYLTGALKVKEGSRADRLRHCFNFLNSHDLNVSVDAYREFAVTDYPDYKDLAKTLPAETIAGWLQDPKTATYRFGLYGSLLGHCGDPKKHGDLLRSMLDDPKLRMGTGIDGLMAGYVMLQPKESYSYLQEVLKSEREEFHTRYAALRTLRFFWDYRNDILSKDQIMKGMTLVLEMGDLADFAIDDLRNWKAWQMTNQILDLFTKDSHKHAVVKRAIMRFALCSPTDRAKDFVKEQRKRDPQWVRDTEEMLLIETPAPKETPEAKKK
jgi:hypothetical protein